MTFEQMIFQVENHRVQIPTDKRQRLVSYTSGRHDGNTKENVTLKGTSDVITYLPQTALNLPQNPVKYVKSCRSQTFSRKYTSNFALLPLRVRLWPPSWNTQ